MNTQIRDLAGKIVDFIKTETSSSSDKWISLNINSVREKWEVPTYMSRYALGLIRINPNIRYKYQNTASRFKPKEYRYDEPSKKLQDLGREQQFELKDTEETYIIQKLKNLICIEESEVFYTLGYYCEKLKIKSLDKEWGIIPVGDFAKFFDTSEASVLVNISLLEKNNILIKSPITLGYKMALSPENAKEALKEVDKNIINNSSEIKGDVNFDIIKNNSFTEIPEIEPLRNALETMVDYNAKMGTLIFKQLQNFDAIKMKDDHLRKQKEIFFRLNNEYTDLRNEFDKSQQEYKTLSLKYEALSRLEDKRTENIRQEMGALNSEIVSLIKAYSQLPLHQKNVPSVLNKLEYDIAARIMEHTKKAIDYREE